MTTIAFFSNKTEFTILKNRDDFTQIKLIALTPEADFLLTDYSGKQNSIEDYYSEKDLNIIGNNSYDKFDEICRTIDEEYSLSENMFSCFDIYMHFKPMYDQLLINHTFCKSILNKEQPDKIILFNIAKLSEEILVINHDDLLINFIFYFFCKKNKIKNEIINYHLPSPSQSRFTFDLRNSISFVKKIFQLNKSILNRIVSLKKTPILLFQIPDFVAYKGMKDKFKLYYQQDIDFKQYDTLAHVNFEFNYCEKLEQLFTFDDISYCDLVSCKIKFIVNVLSVNFMFLIKQYIAMIKKKDIKVVMTGGGQSIEILAAVKAANICKIPIVWVQHGGFYGYGKFKMLKKIINYYTHYFLYATGVHIINNNRSCFTISCTELLNLYKINRIFS